MTEWVQNTAYHEAARAVVAHALGLHVERAYIGDGEEENTGGGDIQAEQHLLPLEDRIAVAAAAIAAKPMFNFEMDRRAERADVGYVASLLLDLDEDARAVNQRSISARKNCCTNIAPRSSG